MATGMGLALFVVVNMLKLSWDAHYMDGYDPAVPLNVQIRSDEDKGGYQRVELTYDAAPGQPVPAILILPKEAKKSFPMIVFVYGIGMEKSFIDDKMDDGTVIAAAFAKRGFGVATAEQYMQGERKLKKASPPQQGLALRERGAMTVIETRRLADYLLTRPDIDPDRLYLVGASYGAMMGSIAAALDPRFKVVVLIYGGADFSKITSSPEAAKMLGPAIGPASQVAGWFMAPCDPALYIHGISPRPVFFQNGRRDRIVPPAAAEVFQQAAKEPKEIRWYDSDHPDKSPEILPIVVNDAMDWLHTHDAEIVAARGRK